MTATLPDEWSTATFSEVARWTKGRKPPRLLQESDSGALPYATADFLRGGMPLAFVDAADLDDCVRAPAGLPVLIWDGSNAGEVFWSARGVLASTMARVEPDLGRLDALFCFYFLRTAYDLLNDGTTGSTIPHVNRAVLGSLQVPLPPKDEQRKIAAVLWKVQKAVEIQDKLIHTTRELKAAAITKVFSQGLHGEVQKETEIGAVPTSWDVLDCESLTEAITVGVVVKPASYYVATGVPAFRSLNIKEDLIDASKLVYFSSQDNDTVLLKSKLKAGDVLVVRTGYPGTSCVVPQEFDGVNCIDLVVVKPKKDRIESEFLSRFLNSERGKSQALANSHGLAQQHLNVGAVRRLKLPVPQLDEQREIVAILQAFDRKISFHTRKRLVLKEIFEALLHELMTASIRVRDLVIDTSEIAA